jgi:nucleoside-diphosphate-sugar epimerase
LGFDIGYFDENIDQKFLPELNTIETIFKDIRDIEENDLKGVEKIVHLAAISNDPMGKLFKDETHHVNFLSTINLAEIGKRVGVKKFIFASSCSMYGSAPGKPRKENDILNPLTDYASSKVNSEVGLKNLATDDFKVICLRFSTACGFSPNLRLDLVLNDFIASSIVNKNITVLSDGSPWRPLIHVKDMAKSIEWALNFEIENNFEEYNVGSDEWTWQIKDLAKNLGSLLNGIEVSINNDASPDKRSYKVDFSKFKFASDEKIKFEDFESSVEEFIRGTINYNFLNFRQSHFMRFNYLKSQIDSKLLDNKLRRL